MVSKRLSAIILFEANLKAIDDINKGKTSWVAEMFRSNRWQMFFKIGVLKNFAKFTGKRLSHSLFFYLKKTLFEKTFGTGVLLWILQTFSEHLFNRAPLYDCFWMLWLNMEHMDNVYGHQMWVAKTPRTSYLVEAKITMWLSYSIINHMSL